MSIIKGIRKYDFDINCQLSPDDIVKKLLYTSDIAFVHPDLYSSLPIAIERQKFLCEQNGEKNMVSKLNLMQNYIKDYHERQNLASRLRRVQISVQKKKKLPFSDEDIQQEIDSILATNTIKGYNTEQAECLYNAMKEKREYFISKGEYNSAAQAEKLSRVLYNAGKLKQVEDMQCEKYDNLSCKIEEAEKELITLKEKWENVYTNFKKTAQADLARLKCEYEEQLHKVGEEKSKDIPPQYKKYSSNYLILRKKERSAVLMKEFSQAAIFKEEADKQQQIEESRFIVTWNKAVDHKKNILAKEFDKSMKAKQVYWQQEEKKLILNANAEVKKFEKSLQNMKVNLESINNAKQMISMSVNNTRNSTSLESDGSVFSPFVRSSQTPAQHRQRALLNQKIYTVTPRKNGTSNLRKRIKE